MTVNNKIGLTNPLTIAQGGTGATAIAQGKSNLGYSVANSRNFIRGGNFDTNPFQRGFTQNQFPYATDDPSNENYSLDAKQCYFIADGFFLHPYVASHTGAFIMRQSNDAPTFSQCGMNVLTCLTVLTGTSTVTANNNNLVQLCQTLDVGIGTPLSGEWTLSFWVKASYAGTYSLTIGSFDSTFATNLASYTITNANTWEFKSITFAPMPIGIFDVAYDQEGPEFISSSFPCIFWNLNAGSNWYQTPNSGWRQFSKAAGVSGQVNLFQSNGDNFNIALVQAEIGPSATSFAYRSPADELKYAQRYYEKSYQTGTLPGTPTRTNASMIIVQPRDGFSNNFDYAYLKVPKPYYFFTFTNPGGIAGGKVTLYSADRGRLGYGTFLSNISTHPSEYPMTVNPDAVSPQFCTTLFEVYTFPPPSVNPLTVGYFHYTIECEPGLYYGY